ALLPPQMLVDQQDASSKSAMDTSMLSRPPDLNGTTDSAAASVYSGAGGDAAGNVDSSSRASSVEPSAEPFAHQIGLHASARRQGVLRPTRGRRPKTRVGARPRTFADDFGDYKNDLLQ
ncbi:hypothetical protein GGI22_003509, partial [Coemansia erecta]